MAEGSTTEREGRGRGVLYRVLAVAAPLLVLVGCVVALVLVFRPCRGGDGGRDGGAPGPTPRPDAAPAVAIDAPPALDPEQAVEQMRQRYRPGPFVRVVGLLPSTRVQGGTITWLRRAGRSVDNPWLVRHGELRPSRAPSASGGADRPALSFASGEAPSQPLSVVAGVPNFVKVQVHHPSPDRTIKGFHVAFGSYLGHFFLPAGSEGRDGEVGTVYVGEEELSTIEFGIDAAVTPAGQPIPPGAPHPVTMYIGAVDDRGGVSDYVTRQLQVVPVGTGDVEVTLTMSQATDLDLYVIEPTGVAIYYRNTTSLAGGQLDLDANAACARNVGVNNEHVFFPRGRAPSGVYTVRVANYTSCIGGGAVDYQVTVRNCGETAVFAGAFTGPGDRATCTSPPGMRQDWCHEVVTFQVTPCQGSP